MVRSIACSKCVSVTVWADVRAAESMLVMGKKVESRGLLTDEGGLVRAIGYICA